MNEFKSFKQIPIPVGQPAKPVTNRQKIKIYQECGTGRVVDDPRLEIEWKPVDKVAARVVAPAKWHDQPPVPKPKFNTEKTMSEKGDKITSPGQSRMRTKTILTEEGFRDTVIDKDSVTAAVVDDKERSIKKELKVTEDLIEKSRELTAAIDYLVTEMRGPWADYQEFIKSAIGTIREERIAIGSETRLLMSALKEVRQFFLEETYEAEINRLHEFIDLCERLQALKESGFLDTVADTILKLNIQ